jgi:hypothetical protein
MCARYNDKETPPKAWPGKDELERITGAKPESNSRAIGRLIDDYGLLFRVTRAVKGQGGKRGNRGEYAPNLKLIASYITDELCIKNEKVLALYRNITGKNATDNPMAEVTNRTDVITYPTSYAKPIEPIQPIIKRIETNNVSNINWDRWNVVIGSLSKDVQKLIKPGSNYETLLDRCIANGMQPTEIRRAIGEISYSNAYKVGGLLNDVLQGLAGVKRAPKSNSALEHCGDEFCDPITRTFPEPAEINGRLDNRCPKCNEQLVNETKRRKDSPPFDLSLLQNFGNLPDD